MKVFTNFIPDEGVDYASASEYTIVLARDEFKALRTALEFGAEAGVENNPQALTMRSMVEAMEGW